MKTPFVGFLLGLLLLGAGRAQEFQEYLIGSIDPTSAKFRNIYETVADADFEERKAAQKVYACEILQNIGEGEYRISQGDGSYVLRIPGGKLIADGTVLELPLIETDEVVQYTTPLGSTVTQAVVTVAPEVERLTMQEFILAMRRGESFDVRLQTGERGCPQCFGHGRVGGGVGKVSSPCAACSATGKQLIFTLFRILW